MVFLMHPKIASEFLQIHALFRYKISSTRLCIQITFHTMLTSPLSTPKYYLMDETCNISTVYFQKT